jgi:hypothetical protein
MAPPAVVPMRADCPQQMVEGTISEKHDAFVMPKIWVRINAGALR